MKTTILVFCLAGSIFATAQAAEELRNIRNGLQIPDEGYCDQPYIVITKDGHWLCTMTTGPGNEGDKGQHIVSTTSPDQGRTWSQPVDIEPSAGPEASWVVPLVVPSGRVYAFYTYNGDNINTLNGKKIRADVHGWYACKYSDDQGKTWSSRHRLPLRVTACDRGNDWKGRVQIFWGIDKPKIVGPCVMFAFTKLGKYMLDLGEGWTYRSDNILVENDAARLRWELLPSGEHGIRAPEFGSVQEEHNLVPLSDGSLYCVYRTALGFPCHAYSRDGGRNWSKPQPMTYTPLGRKIKTPRACPKLWRTENGKFLFWFHNNSGGGTTAWTGRNLVWLAGGVEKDGHIHWSQPEILLYDPDSRLGMSYPDLIEQNGRYWVSETQKTVARVHPLDKSLLEGLWSQGQVKTLTRNGLLLDLGAEQLRSGSVKLPRALNLAAASGLSIDLSVRFDTLSSGQVILDSRTPDGKGVALVTTEKGTVQIELADGVRKVVWDCDAGRIQAGKFHHLAVLVDAGPKVISFVVDGLLCDGGQARPSGWARFPKELADVSGTGRLRIGPSLQGQVKRVRVYDRSLRTSEAITNYFADR